MNDIENIIWETSEQSTQDANREAASTFLRSNIIYFTTDEIASTNFITKSIVSDAIDKILFK